ncbi:DUF2202 domain-containing protein [Vibrio sp. CAIM 722]|uniref:DUF2202 domain-containing protein n=1 Tax=Vibrio eleionomae TaxID=2653505 RepID=A0A7X4RVF9_9VIBR|nr:DUF2202 domain-containing protein [Vibrio eleionomae]MZI94267.1 DUF2202 domain-containing protein [Vibrio eleionomae]
MMNNITSTLLLSALATLPMSALATNTDFGAQGAKQTANPTLEQMMEYAIQDEYHAKEEYRLIMQTYGAIRPFTNIIRAEQKHIERLTSLYQQRGVATPDDTAKEHVVVPDSLKNAFSTGVSAEIDNIAMYQSFLNSELLKKPENSDIKGVFTALMNASKNHLSAFERHANRY